MSAPDLLERTRMALAEAGYPEATVRQDGDDIWITTSGARQNVERVDCWRAFEASGAHKEMLGRYVCWEHYGDADPDACLADRPLVRDCGLPR